jgi:hypothetical protein
LRFGEEDEDALARAAWQERTSVLGLAACEASDFFQREPPAVFYGSYSAFDRTEGAAL